MLPKALKKDSPLPKQKANLFEKKGEREVANDLFNPVGHFFSSRPRFLSVSVETLVSPLI